MAKKKKQDDSYGINLAESINQLLRISTYMDPFRFMTPDDTIQKPSRVPPDLLIYARRNVPIITAMMERRLSQISQVSNPIPEKSIGNEVGWDIRHKNYRDPDFNNKKPEIQKRTHDIRNKLLTPYYPDCETFAAYLRACSSDHLVHDRIATEIIPNRLGTKVPAGFTYVSGHTIHLFAPFLKQYMLKNQIRSDREAVNKIVDEYKKKNVDYRSDKLDRLDVTTRYVQIVNAEIVAEFDDERMFVVYEEHDPDIRFSGYGYSKIEKSIRTVTDYVNAITYNSAFFTSGALEDYVMTVKGGFTSKEAQSQFEEDLKKRGTGMKSAHKTLINYIDETSDFQINPLRQSNKDMEFLNFINYVVALLCGIWDMDTSEINMSNFAAHGTTLFGRTKDEEIESKKAGFYNLINFHRSWINKNLISRYDPDYEWVVVGLDEEMSEQEQVTILKSRDYMTLNEQRKSDGLSPIKTGIKIKDNDIADVPLASQLTFLMQSAAQQQMQEQQSQQSQQGGGQPGMEQGGGEDDEMQPGMTLPPDFFEKNKGGLDELQQQETQGAMESNKAHLDSLNKSITIEFLDA